MTSAYLSTAKQSEKSISAGASSDLRGKQRLARARFGRQNNELTLAKAAGPLIEFVDVGVNL